MKKPLLAILLVIMCVGIALSENMPISLSFTKFQGDVVATHRTSSLLGPHYAKVDCWHEAHTKKIHLEYTLFQNIDTCKKSKDEVELKWNLKDTGVTWENHKEFTYHLKDQKVMLNSEDISRIAELLLPKK